MPYRVYQTDDTPLAQSQGEIEIYRTPNDLGRLHDLLRHGAAGHRGIRGMEGICYPLIGDSGEAVDNIDAICAVDSIGVFVVAGFDPSTVPGIPGQLDHSDFKAAVSRAETAVKAADVTLENIASPRRKPTQILQ